MSEQESDQQYTINLFFDRDDPQAPKGLRAWLRWIFTGKLVSS